MACSDSDDEFAAFFPVSTRKKEGNDNVICPAFLMTALRSGFSPRRLRLVFLLDYWRI
jgi:hypothetical protein